MQVQNGQTSIPKKLEEKIQSVLTQNTAKINSFIQRRHLAESSLTEELSDIDFLSDDEDCLQACQLLQLQQQAIKPKFVQMKQGQQFLSELISGSTNHLVVPQITELAAQESLEDLQPIEEVASFQFNKSHELQ